MNTNSILKKEGIEIKSKLNPSQITKIANIVSNKIAEAFPEHNLNRNDLFSRLSSLAMYIAKMPEDSVVAKYFSQNNSIYFSHKMDLNNLDTLVIHECIHAIQEQKSPRGKLQKLGLYNLTTSKGQGINEAAVQLMASIATGIKNDRVKYYHMDFSTPSPLFYPIQTALINQMIFFTGSYPLFHSTLHSNTIFQNTFIAKSDEKTYHMIEENFDLILHYEELLSFCFAELSDCSQEQKSLRKIKRINEKINWIKSKILNVTITTQNRILESCFEREFDLIKDATSLNTFQQRLYHFNDFLIHTESYHFYTQFYYHMMNKLDEKREFIQLHGTTLNYLNDLQTDLLDLEQAHFGLKFFRRLLDKMKLLFEEALRDKNENNL